MKSPHLGASVVYLHPYAKTHCAAIVVKVHDPNWVALKVFSPDGQDSFASFVEWGVSAQWPTEALEMTQPLGPLDWSGIG
jgi:hypothetical protein